MCNSFGISLLTQTPNCPWDRKTNGRVGLWNSHGLIHVQTNASVWLWVHVCRSALTDPHFSVYFWDFGGARRVNQERKWLTALWRCLPLCSHISTGQRALSRLCWYLRWRGGKRSKPAVRVHVPFHRMEPLGWPLRQCVSECQQGQGPGAAPRAPLWSNTISV